MATTQNASVPLLELDGSKDALEYIFSNPSLTRGDYISYLKGAFNPATHAQVIRSNDKAFDTSAVIGSFKDTAGNDRYLALTLAKDSTGYVGVLLTINKLGLIIDAWKLNLE